MRATLGILTLSMAGLLPASASAESGVTHQSATSPQSSVPPTSAADAVSAALVQQQIVAQQVLMYAALQANGAQPTPITRSAQAAAARQASEYMTNGAQATAVPTSGPAAAYYADGAGVTTAPTSAIPNYSFSPPFAPVPAVTAGGAGSAAPTDMSATSAPAVPASGADTAASGPVAGLTSAAPAAATSPDVVPVPQPPSDLPPGGLDAPAAQPTSTRTYVPEAPGPEPVAPATEAMARPNANPRTTGIGLAERQGVEPMSPSPGAVALMMGFGVALAAALVAIGSRLKGRTLRG